MRLVARETLRSLEDRIEEADDLLEELARRPARGEAAETLRAERLRLRHQRRGLRLTLDTLEGRRKPLPDEPAGRALTTDELEGLYRACEGDPDSVRGRRQAAMVTLLLVVRRLELARLELSDLDAETGRVLVREGKGGKTATTWAPEQGLPAVRRWLEVRGSEPGLFLRISYDAIYRQLAGLAARAGLGAATPHDLRRTACTGLLAVGVKPHLVQKQMRHADFGTTQRYDHSGQDEVRRAVARLPVPCAR